MKTNVKGITLVALVITIVVLLILSGITISTLTGDNGVLRETKNSKQLAEDASLEESIQLAVNSSQTGENGEVDFNILNSELDRLGYVGTDLNELPTEIDVNGKHYEILEDGEAKRVLWWYSDKTKSKITNGTDTFEIGTKVNYNSGKDESGNSLSNVKYSSTKTKNGHSDQEFVATSYTGEWAILGVEHGQILIMPNSTLTSQFRIGCDMTNDPQENRLKNAQTGYTNAVSELNSIGAVYGHGKGATGGRSINVEDVNKVTGYDPNNVGTNMNSENPTLSGKKYGESTIEQYGNRITLFWDGNYGPYYESDVPDYSGKNMEYNYWNSFYYYENGLGKSSKNPNKVENKQYITTITSNYYRYYPETLTIETKATGAKIGIQSGKAYNLLFKESYSYWLASTCVRADDSIYSYGVREVSNKLVGTTPEIWNSIGNNFNGKSSNVCPVVYLKSDIVLKDSSGTLQIQ